MSQYRQKHIKRDLHKHTNNTCECRTSSCSDWQKESIIDDNNKDNNLTTTATAAVANTCTMWTIVQQPFIRDNPG